MSVGWFDTVAEANAYFSGERLETTAWDALAEVSGNLERTKALMQAFNRLFFSDLYDVPDYASATAEELIFLKKAQAELAYYLAQHLVSEDRRKGIQAQGVIGAGVVKETYAEDCLSKLPLPAIVQAIMKQFEDAVPFYVREVARDENEAVDEDVSGF